MTKAGDGLYMKKKNALSQCDLLFFLSSCGLILCYTILKLKERFLDGNELWLSASRLSAIYVSIKLIVGFLQFSLYWCLCNIKNVADFASVQPRLICRVQTSYHKTERKKGLLAHDKIIRGTHNILFLEEV